MQIATAFGIPIRIHWSFFAGLALVLWWVGLANWVGTLLVAVGLFGSVLLHELGHALAARYYGIETRDITLYPFGGIAAITRMPRNPTQELVIAIAGPAVNGVLFALFGFLAMSFGSWAAGYLAVINAGMGLFNLIPAFPMDGGRVLRALLASQMGWMRASSVSIKIGQGFAWAFIGLGIAFGAWNLILLGGFLLVALASERARLTQIAWERARYGWTDWGSTDPWGGRPSARYHR